MGWRLLVEVLDHGPDGLSWRDRHVLQVLAFSARDEGPDARLVTNVERNPRLQARLRLGRSQRYAALATLVDRGALERVERGRNGVPASYRLPVFVSPMSLKEGASPGSRTLQSRNPDPSDPSRVRETRTLEGSRFPGRFVEFWGAYPRRVGEQEAAKAFTAAVADGADPGELAAAAARFAASLNGVPLGKVCRPARWLAERWDLDFPAERKVDLGGSP
jgi:hypothetical protein